MTDLLAIAPWRHRNTRRVLDVWAPASGAFDPAGTWEHAYNIYFLNVRPKKGQAAGKGKAATPAGAIPKPDGTLKLACAPKGAGIELRVESSGLMIEDLTTARVECAADALCSPMKWDLAYTNKTAGGPKYAAFSRTGEVSGGALRRSDLTATPAVGAAWTSDWSLFAAIQRLAAAGAEKALTFDLVEYLDVVRTGQHLRYRGQAPVECGGKTIEAREYLQWGEGALPTHYYVDANNRLFMVLGSRRLFTLMEERA